mmetsp:Transcript_53926/g.101090  ORF Transcript_53926/g.101090 Transcript_53926/m.101090 type:complete len:226 (+) Transcript_53926:384-1061(+)
MEQLFSRNLRSCDSCRNITEAFDGIDWTLLREVLAEPLDDRCQRIGIVQDRRRPKLVKNSLTILLCSEIPRQHILHLRYKLLNVHLHVMQQVYLVEDNVDLCVEAPEPSQKRQFLRQLWMHPPGIFDDWSDGHAIQLGTCGHVVSISDTFRCIEHPENSIRRSCLLPGSPDHSLVQTGLPEDALSLVPEGKLRDRFTNLHDAGCVCKNRLCSWRGICNGRQQRQS